MNYELCIWKHSEWCIWNDDCGMCTRQIFSISLKFNWHNIIFRWPRRRRNHKICAQPIKGVYFGWYDCMTVIANGKMNMTARMESWSKFLRFWFFLWRKTYFNYLYACRVVLTFLLSPLLMPMVIFIGVFLFFHSHSFSFVLFFLFEFIIIIDWRPGHFVRHWIYVDQWCLRIYF